ncbi:DMT family transporter [Azospirillum sp. ST 5-10]|uniref:DMT family transporter n=1 Tax=unclassified Azospirillum TaxID=2630922 RepID=UPI003F4A2A75
MSTTAAAANRPEVGIPLALLAVLCFTLLDSFGKALGGAHAMPMLVWARYAFGLAWLLLLIPRGSGVSVLRTARPWVHVARGLLVMTATGFTFAAVRHLPLATFYAIAFLSPLLVALLSVVVLRERVTLVQWGAILAGFAGVLIVVRPGLIPLDWTILLPFGMAASYALYQILTRLTGVSDPPVTALFYMTLVGFVTASAVLPLSWEWPGPSSWAAFVVMGALGTVGHLFLIKALAAAPPSVVSPFTYSQMVWAVLIGIVWFDQAPDPATLAGAAVIIASGLWLMRGSRPAASRPSPS